MAYAPTISIAVATGTPLKNQIDTATVTVNNSSGTVDVVIDGVEVVPDTNSPLIVGETSPDWLPQAGSNQAATYGKTTVTAGTNATFTFPIIAPVAGTYNINANVIGTRSDNGSRIMLCTSSAAQIVVS